MINRGATFEVDGLKIAGRIYLPDEVGSYPAVCVCHGIPHSSPDLSSDISARGYPLLAERVCREGLAVLLFNFRGTGDSEGNFDILGWTRDLGAALNYLWTLPGVNRSRLSLLGFSGGAAVSVYVAAQDRRVSSVAACACPAEFASFLTEPEEPRSVIDHFRSIGIIRDKGFPSSTEEWLDNFRLVSPVNYVARISPRPLLLVHGSQDETVNVSHAHKLYAQAGEPKQIAIIDGVGHRLRQDERAMTIVIAWLQSQARNST